jgi:hypothetical protein
MRLLYVYGIGVEEGGIANLSASFYARQTAIHCAIRCEHLAVANRSLVSIAVCDNDLAGKAISTNVGMIV